MIRLKVKDPSLPFVFKLLQQRELPAFLLFDEIKLRLLLQFVLTVSHSFEALDGCLSCEGIVGVEVQEDELKSEAHNEAVSQEEGLICPEGWDCDLMLLQDVEI